MVFNKLKYTQLGNCFSRPTEQVMKSSVTITAPTTFHFLWFLFLGTIISPGLCHGSSFSGLCIQDEREALLTLKHDLTDPSNRLASWTGSDGDCCRWSGVVCHNLTGHVLELRLRSLSEDEFYDTNATLDYREYIERFAFGGKVSPSLLNLKHLKYLDLSNNNFEGIPFPKFLGSMKSLRHLDLSIAGFGGMIPDQFGNLSNLQYLDLYCFSEAYVENLDWLTSMSSLEFLSLSFVNLSLASNWLNVISTMPSLVELHFSFCNLPNVPPLINVNNFSSISVLDLSGNFLPAPTFDFLQNVTSLKALDLFSNNFNSSIPSWLYGFSCLQFLNLADNQLQGNMSNAIGNMTSLVEINFAVNELEGTLPPSFKNLCNLRSLSLWPAKLNQEIKDIFEILFPCISNVMEALDLEDCQLSGHLPYQLGQFKYLEYLDLSNNFISGPIPISLGDLKSMKILDLSQNKLNGTLPQNFGGLAELEGVYLSYNALVGDVSEIHFANLTKLSSFRASGNKMNLRVRPDWSPPSQLGDIDLGAWNVGPEFPRWIGSLKYLRYLNLSSSGIASTVPVWFWNLSSNFYLLNISHNQIHGVIPNLPNFHSRQLFDGGTDSLVDLSWNNFQGALPYIFSNVRALYLSNNSFSVPLSKFLCYKMNDSRFLEVLDVGDNLLSGEMPNCWTKWRRLVVLNLSNNKLSGTIPWSIGALSYLESLHLRNNRFSGEIPLSLRNCTALSTLDLGENELGGKIPTWIGETFLDMVILSLRSNKFHGRIPKEFCLMSSLYILDLADNNLSSTIPKCLSNFSAMASKNDSIGMLLEGDASSWPFYESVFIVTKGKVNGYSSILKFVRSIDLSKNKLSGDIPEEITSLKGLQYLNLSNNLLKGRIPADIGAMESLESLDFSQNQLFGEIPQSMAKLTFLSDLNLSFNDLNGRIPSSTQLRGFSPSCFMDNEGLCGAPLTKNCSEDGEMPRSGGVEGGNGDDNGHEVNWFYVSMALGFVVGFWGAFGPLVLNRRWRHVYFGFLDSLWDRIWWRLSFI